MSYLALAKKIRSGLRSDTAENVACDFTDGQIKAVLIFSHVVEAQIWFALDDCWKPDIADTTPVYYATEISILRHKTAEQLRQIHKTKLAYPGWRVAEEMDPSNRK